MKHKEIIKAWLDGAEIEWRGPLAEEGTWRAVPNVDAFGRLPNFGDDCEYRIKPKTHRMYFESLGRSAISFCLSSQSAGQFWIDFQDGTILNVGMNKQGG